MLDEQEKYRYDRQLKLEGFGLTKQEQLKKSSVLVIGAGGLGCPALLYLAAAGVGRIGIVDPDTINVTNLHRQILFDEHSIGNNKALAAAARIKQINSLITTEAYPQKLDAELALKIFRNYDVIMDATDNFSTRYLINDVCVLYSKPFVYGSVYKTEGQISVFNYQGKATYRCLHPEPAKQIPSCEEIGVLGPVCGIIGTKQANETLKILTGIGTVLSGEIEFYNSSNEQTFRFKIPRNEILEALTEPEIRALNYPLFCGESENSGSLNSKEFQELLKQAGVQVFDIRMEWEEPELDYGNTVRVPLHEIESAVKLLDRTQKIVVVCQYGTRSNLAVEYLRKKHQFNDVVQLKGGLTAFFGA